MDSRFVGAHPPIRRSLAMVAVWLVIVNLFALLAFNRLNLAPDTAFEWMDPGGRRAGSAELGPH
ncbi:MAG: hypothetical protein MZV70_60785 [Desulfobacterales bacterium]|nr:hypothetical protein [Desulfobacterales bacterium]